MLAAFRKHLHRHPELSGREKKTQAFIHSYVEEHFGLVGKAVADTGLLYRFSFGEGPHLLVRVDIDALPIQEVNTFDHCSIKDGVSHKCGHDGHATIGVGLIGRLHKEPLPRGQVTVLFQPAEEVGEGAQKVIKDPEFHLSDYDYALALHNIPGAPRHHILWKEQQFTSAVQSIIFRFFGKTSHAAEPLKGKNPAYVIGDLLQYARDNEVTDDTDPDFHLLTPIFAELGSRDYGISAGFGELHFTIRSWAQARMEEVTRDLTHKARKLAGTAGLGIDEETLAAFAANRNHPFLVGHIRKAAKKLELPQTERAQPFPWGEDFGIFTQRIPGAMFGLGAGEDTPALHNPDYDFPDEILETGINMFYETAKSITGSEIQPDPSE